MDVALTNSIVNTATSLASAKTSDAVAEPPEKAAPEKKGEE